MTRHGRVKRAGTVEAGSIERFSLTLEQLHGGQSEGCQTTVVVPSGDTLRRQTSLTIVIDGAAGPGFLPDIPHASDLEFPAPSMLHQCADTFLVAAASPFHLSQPAHQKSNWFVFPEYYK